MVPIDVLPFCVVLAAAAIHGPAVEPVWVIDTVQVAPGRKEMVLNFYRSAWLPARKEALRRKLILDFKAIELDDRPQDGVRILLMTQYADRKDIAAAEPAWQSILKKVSPRGAIVPPGMKSSDIRTIIRSDLGTEPFAVKGS